MAPTRRVLADMEMSKVNTNPMMLASKPGNADKQDGQRGLMPSQPEHQDKENLQLGFVSDEPQPLPPYKNPSALLQGSVDPASTSSPDQPGADAEADHNAVPDTDPDLIAELWARVADLKAPYLDAAYVDLPTESSDVSQSVIFLYEDAEVQPVVATGQRQQQRHIVVEMNPKFSHAQDFFAAKIGRDKKPNASSVAEGAASGGRAEGTWEEQLEKVLGNLYMAPQEAKGVATEHAYMVADMLENTSTMVKDHLVAHLLRSHEFSDVSTTMTAGTAAPTPESGDSSGRWLVTRRHETDAAPFTFWLRPAGFPDETKDTYLSLLGRHSAAVSPRREAICPYLTAQYYPCDYTTVDKDPTVDKANVRALAELACAMLEERLRLGYGNGRSYDDIAMMHFLVLLSPRDYSVWRIREATPGATGEVLPSETLTPEEVDGDSGSTNRTHLACHGKQGEGPKAQGKGPKTEAKKSPAQAAARLGEMATLRGPRFQVDNLTAGKKEGLANVLSLIAWLHGIHGWAMDTYAPAVQEDLDRMRKGGNV